VLAIADSGNIFEMGNIFNRNFAASSTRLICDGLWRRGRNNEYTASKTAASKAGPDAISEADSVPRFVLEMVLGALLVRNFDHDRGSRASQAFVVVAVSGIGRVLGEE
jgi:hypothetical protein